MTASHHDADGPPPDPPEVDLPPDGAPVRHDARVDDAPVTGDGPVDDALAAYSSAGNDLDAHLDAGERLQGTLRGRLADLGG